MAGSFLITWSLYKASPSLRRKKVRDDVADYFQTSRPMATHHVVDPARVELLPVEVIAPLQISTPKNVELPQVKLELLVEPQSSQLRKLSRAQQLAILATRAKQQKKQSLIDSVDIRRRNPWASFS